MKKNKILILSLILLMIFNLTSCVRHTFTAPPDDCVDASLTANLTIKELKNLYDGSQQIVEITEDYIVEATVISSDREGNYYKTLIVQDETGGISIGLDRTYVYNDFPEGQKIYIKCKGLHLGESGGVVSLGSTWDDAGVTLFGRIQGDVVIDAHIIRSCVNEPMEPTVLLTLDQVDEKYVNTLVKVENVQFVENMLDTTFANSQAEKPISYNLNIEDKHSAVRIFRTSGYCTFAMDSVPKGSGTMTAILGLYNGDYQFIVNKPEDLVFDKERFTPGEPLIVIPYLKDFEDQDLNSKGWTTQLPIGTVNWEIGDYGNYAQISNWNGQSNSISEAWFISPNFDLSEALMPIVSFDNAMNYDGPDLQAKYSTDYDGVSAPSTATWTDITFTLSNGNWNWKNSGEIELPKGESVCVAFIYTGSSSSGATWEIDNIKIRDIGK